MAKLNTEMSVSGIGQFKQAMSQGKTAVKALDAELKLNAAQFKNSGDKEEYLRKRTELLNRQIAEQEKVVKASQDALEKMAEQGAERNSAAYLKMQEQVAKAQTELVNMRSALTDGTDAMSEGADAADELADKLESIDKKVTFNAVLQGLKAVKDVASGVISTLTNGIKAAWEAMSEAADWADNLNTTAAKYGFDQETVQRMEYASGLIDVDAETLMGAWKKINKLKTENGVTYLNNDYAMAAIEGSKLDQVFQVLEALSLIADESERAVIAQDIFGKSWEDLQPAFGQKEEYYAAMAEARIVNDEDVQALQALDDAQQKLDNAWQTFLLNVAADFAPTFQKFTEDLIEILDKLQEMLDSPQGKALVERITSSFLQMANALSDPTNLNRLLDTIDSALRIVAGILGIDLSTPTQTAADAVEKVGLRDNGTMDPATYQRMLMSGQFTKEELDAAISEQATKAGVDTVEAMAEGALENAEAAAATGRYLGEQMVSNAAAAVSGNTYNTDSTYIDTVNITGANPDELRDQINKANGQSRAGVGS